MTTITRYQAGCDYAMAASVSAWACSPWTKNGALRKNTKINKITRLPLKLQTNQTFRGRNSYLFKDLFFQSNRGIVSRVILTNWRSKRERERGYVLQRGVGSRTRFKSYEGVLILYIFFPSKCFAKYAYVHAERKKKEVFFLKALFSVSFTWGPACEDSPVKRVVNSLGRVALFHSVWLIVWVV